MTDLSSSWLMVIDLQPAFSHPDSPWFTPSLAEAAQRIGRLVPLFEERVLFTRFVPLPERFGSWQAYYDKWSFAHAAEAAWLWALDDPWKGRRSISSHTFSKWRPPIEAELGAHPHVVLCGVSTDCCVLATALGAVDAGAHVQVVTDACAAKSPEVHESALRLMAMRAPQLALTHTDALVGSGNPAARHSPLRVHAT
jgi:nicotinamidase-related amidase